MMTSLKDWLYQYLSIGIKADTDEDIGQKIFVSNLFALIGYSIAFILAVSASVREEWILASALYIATALFLASHHVHRFGKLKNSHQISTRIVYVSLLLLMIYLIYTGGRANTGPLWLYVVPPVAFYFGGMRTGFKNIGIFAILISTMLFYPNDALLQAEYTFEFKTRLLYSFLTVALLFGFYEHSRQQSFKRIKTLSENFEKQAMQDPLTHLANRRGMREHLEYEFNRTLRSKLDMSIILCDIDNFKSINDVYGHEAGDQILASLSKQFTGMLRKQDKVSRWGGEEFLFLLPETNGFEAYTLAEKVRKKIERSEYTYKGKKISITLSLGINEVTEDSGIDNAINLADHFLYQAKENGRNQTKPDQNKLA